MDVLFERYFSLGCLLSDTALMKYIFPLISYSCYHYCGVTITVLGNGLGLAGLNPEPDSLRECSLEDVNPYLLSKAMSK